MDDVELAPSEFVALLNQTLEFAYPSVVVQGELANFRVSKNRWVYFDLKDELATVRFFGSVYQLPGPLEDGMVVKVRGTPRLHPQFGFSVTTHSITPAGEGSIKKAAALLEAKLKAEGMFDLERKRLLPYPPRHIGLVTSGESAAYRDFIKVLSARWGGVRITLVDVQVQGEAAPAQITQAIALLNQAADTPDVLVITRGGGSADDLQAFSTEQVTRAVAASRIPTIVAIGHEVDMSLAELAADVRASTPSNAAELLVPDRLHELARLEHQKARLTQSATAFTETERRHLVMTVRQITHSVETTLRQAQHNVGLQKQLLAALNPQAALTRGYALVYRGKQAIRSAAQASVGDALRVAFADADLEVTVQKKQMKEDELNA